MAAVTRFEDNDSVQVREVKSDLDHRGPPALDGHVHGRVDQDPVDSQYGQWIRKVFQEPARCRLSAIGIAYHNLHVFGFGTQTDYQKTLANYPRVFLSRLASTIYRRPKSRIDILRNFEGLVRSGEMLVVLGRPGSGCSTLLKTLAGQTHGIYVHDHSVINYQGIPPKIMHGEFRGECTYQAESDVHFPNLTVGQTLCFAAKARAVKNSILDSGRTAYANNVVQATASSLGLSDALSTKVGNDFIQGVSGGERKRTSIAEVLVGGSSFQCWDNATRGLDSAVALKFARTLRVSTEASGSVAIVSLYQASQAIYDVFDKVVLLYEGRQIFFGDVGAAKSYFTELGFICSDRVTTADFLTSLTNPIERSIQDGHEHRVPRTPDEFADVWKSSKHREILLRGISHYEKQFPLGDINGHLGKRRAVQAHQKSNGLRHRSPYTISVPQQVGLCASRGFQRLRNDLVAPVSNILGNCVMSIILGSIFYNLSGDTNSFFGRGVLLFFTVLLNTFLGAFESVALWAQKPIVEKHFQYAFYHPFTEALASVLCDIPNKILLTMFFNIPVYFLANLRRTPSAFLTFYLFAFVSLLTGSFHFRFSGAISRTITGSIAPGATLAMMLLIFTGFVLPIPNMPPWFRWFNYINPIAYAFESLMINEFSRRKFSCATIIPQGPGYTDVAPEERMCSVVGSRPGSTVVDGDEYLAASFRFHRGHLWRNLGIIFAFMAFLCVMYLLASEKIHTQRSKGEILVFCRDKAAKFPSSNDEEAWTPDQPTTNGVEKTRSHASKYLSASNETRAATFLWDELSYDVPVRSGSRRLLHSVEGWIKPGTLTALMGASGAGKTTLLNVLADRASTGVVGGEKLVNAQYENEAFARKVGYAQQQDLHLSTSTVREALRFSALLRQSEKYSKVEKLAYVDEIIETLDMSKFADAVIGNPGEGLNVEQRKRVTIGVELAARPELLIFLDEPTSGLDSDTAWAICTLLRKLADNGHAILCTIHQPSATIFQMFDRLLFLSNGHSLYFGDIGHNSKHLTTYFEGHGARRCKQKENPAEWLLDIASDAPSASPTQDWAQTWEESEARRKIKTELLDMKELLSNGAMVVSPPTRSQEFAMSFLAQLVIVTQRNLQKDWRTPSYLWSKIFLAIGMALFNGLSFYNSPNSLQGLQNQLFSVFILTTFFSNVTQLITPQFIDNRTLYEVRERPCRTYSWKVFILSNIIAEIPWQTVTAVLFFGCWYYPLGLYHNAAATEQVNERAALVYLFLWSYMIFCSTFAQLVAVVMPDAATGVNISSLLFSLSLIFSGVLVSASGLPGFWIWMYRVSPLTYFISGLMSAGVSGVPVECAAKEMVQFRTPNGQSCGAYLAKYMAYAGGRLLDPETTETCQLCPLGDTDFLLHRLGIFFENRWRDFGITLVYSVINVAGALLLYWLARVPRKPRKLQK